MHVAALSRMSILNAAVLIYILIARKCYADTRPHGTPRTQGTGDEKKEGGRGGG